ncbi:hypothetical protein MQH10_04765 [Phenylobacterium aquaticum]|nr:hypothetical protein [Phenylobacterium aquaticum]MCI3131660.1 hypothetical protein [Phenylobacterium aquaticum]
MVAGPVAQHAAGDIGRGEARIDGDRQVEVFQGQGALAPQPVDVAPPEQGLGVVGPAAHRGLGGVQGGVEVADPAGGHRLGQQSFAPTFLATQGLAQLLDRLHHRLGRRSGRGRDGMGEDQAGRGLGRGVRGRKRAQRQPGRPDERQDAPAQTPHPRIGRQNTTTSPRAASAINRRWN